MSSRRRVNRRNNNQLDTDSDFLNNAANNLVTTLMVFGLIIGICLFVLGLFSFVPLIASTYVIVFGGIHVAYIVLGWYSTRGVGECAENTCKGNKSGKTSAFAIVSGFLAILAIVHVIWILFKVNFFLGGGCALYAPCAGITWAFLVSHGLILVILIIEVITVFVAYALTRNIKDTCVTLGHDCLISHSIIAKKKGKTSLSKSLIKKVLKTYNVSNKQYQHFGDVYNYELFRGVSKGGYKKFHHPEELEKMTGSDLEDPLPSTSNDESSDEEDWN